ncbi:MAG TPA: CDP-diacylglycerol--glycerol-3-phosphate 3-phosphatidyltransferase [Desulfobulbaceae bacterium]|nr:MAG: CDP-diacylglycerol--glycerol-3-phosphate 3-phosphatidyltransferase [Deltaproteobacteria bacterium RIFOXYD12_FULL_53_23]HCC55079.1 CDP-diacylglycerol--glycerol-3-phosphate 3-phosphatidyltransferase [Desulfobulbaceae bacterium]
MNIPNLLTIGRILLIPLLVIFLIDGEKLAAFWVFVLAGVTDALDGFLARVLKQKTDFGAFIDPIADKLLLITSYITLAVLDILPKWLTVIVVSRDVLICGGIGILMLYDREFKIKPSLISKVTTFMQLLTVVYFLGHDYFKEIFPVVNYLIYATAACTILSGMHYMIRGLGILGDPDATTQR